jgi:uncharacterized membrane protein
MTLFLILLIVAAMLATLFVLIRGLVNMAGATTTELEDETEGPTPRAIKSNKLMQSRILLQAVAILLIAILLAVASASGS